MAFIHSCYSTANNHAPASMEISGGLVRPGYPSLGSWVTYGLGSMNDNLPAFVVMHDDQAARRRRHLVAGLPAQELPAAAARLPAQKEAIANLARGQGMTDAQQRAQLDLLRQLNQEHQQQQPLGSRPGGAHPVVRAGLPHADGRPGGARPEPGDRRRRKKLYGLDDKDCATFGRQCLIARRLVERGVRFVQIFCRPTASPAARVADVPWDGHNDIETNHRDCGHDDRPAGRGAAADLKARGLLDSTLVIWGGEFGRTSDSQGSKGRDHNPHAYTIWLAGGGVKGGVHYGTHRRVRLQGGREPRRASTTCTPRSCTCWAWTTRS